MCQASVAAEPYLPEWEARTASIARVGVGISGVPDIGLRLVTIGGPLVSVRCTLIAIGRGLLDIRRGLVEIRARLIAVGDRLVALGDVPLVDGLGIRRFAGGVIGCGRRVAPAPSNDLQTQRQTAGPQSP